MSQKIVLASGNKGKLKEFNEILSRLEVEVIPQSEFSVPDADETGLTFVENAIIKARHACELTGLPALADDSGLEVDALNGEPGIYSARYAGGGDANNNQKLMETLGDTPIADRSARYRCVLVFMRHAKDPMPLICQGTLEGKIGFEPQGEQGFGYDPLFIVDGYDKTAAQMQPEEKHRISHRGQAVKAFMEKIEEYIRVP